jgi:hypothetical protein
MKQANGEWNELALGQRDQVRAVFSAPNMSCSFV